MKNKKVESVLFTPIKIGVIEIPNRFVRSATHDFMAAHDGSITEKHISLFENLARGEVGLIITGHAYINPGGKASPYQIGICTDDLIEGLGQITEAVHRYPSRIFLQLSHAGRQTNPKLCGTTPLAPSSVYEPIFKITPKEMSHEEIKAVIGDFIQSCHRAKQAGFDGVQLHVAHGYLLSSFISPYTNRRKDEWGGPLSNRLRIVVEIIRGIKGLEGKEFPLIVKLNSSDFLPHGLKLEESIEIAKILEKEGIDAIEVSGGMAEAGKGSVWKGLRSEEEEAYFVDNAARIKKAISIPVFALGGIRSFSVMEKIIEKGKSDLISLSRPFIRDPLMVMKFRTGMIQKSECISCNKCFNLRGISCAELKKKGDNSEQ
ncbi:MAG: NADH:flavin oxidoreductase [Candidatus Aminicenantes bacterium]|nr:NADH:flavin oxidoreductase [Candidatus Aminicenantes bacterium]